MKKKTKDCREAGLSFAGEGEKERGYERIFPLLLTLSVYISFIGVFMAILESDDLPWAAIAVGTAVAFMEHFTPGGKTKWIANCVLLSVSVIALIIWRSAILDGMRLILNQMFTVSEKYQQYIYERFPISANAGNHSLCITAAMIFICGVSAVMCHYAVRQKSGSLLEAIFLMTLAAEIYYGIFPQLWTVILFGITGLCVLYRQHNGKAFVSSVILLAVAMIASVIVLAAYTGPSAQQTALTEDIRDRLDEHIEQQVNNPIKPRQEQVQKETENTDLKEDKVSDRSDDTSAGKNFQTKHEKQFEGNRAGLAHKRMPWIWIFVGLILLSLLFRYFVRMHRAKKRRRVFDSSDYAAAIDGMFRHSVNWLEACGLKTGNSLFSQYSKQVSKMLSEEYGMKYSAAVRLWEETVYSSHVMGEKEVGRMREFLDDTSENVRDHVGAFTRFKIKYCYFL